MTAADIEQSLDAAFLAWGKKNPVQAGNPALHSLSNSPAVMAGAFSQVMG